MKKSLKFLVLAFAHLSVIPLGIAAVVTLRAFRSEVLFDFGAKALAIVPGLPGQYLRFAFYKQTLVRVGADLVIAFGSYFSHATAQVGSGVSIGAYCILGTVDIGDNTQIASRVSVLSGRHQHGQPGSGGGIERSASFQRVRIGSNVWLGEGAIVMADVGDNSIVGAGAVVVKPVQERQVAVGNPAQARPIQHDNQGSRGAANSHEGAEATL
jgi:acetyltransferase-like isoleucine patch superfamily enzyme